MTTPANPDRELVSRMDWCCRQLNKELPGDLSETALD